VVRYLKLALLVTGRAVEFESRSRISYFQSH
jgi:hypothetical protein